MRESARCVFEREQEVRERGVRARETQAMETIISVRGGATVA